jgi:amino-acid N-acetyltransferase
MDVEDLLRLHRLPTADISAHTELYAIRHNGQVLGCIGLERYGDIGLLRSLAVQEHAKGQGWGKALVEKLEAQAKQQGIEQLVLLTETADQFFAKLGYLRIDRNDVPESVKRSSEFAHVCPASAVVMIKKL